jgi:hypothetical protein
MRFFLLWSAGVLGMAVFGRAMSYANPNWAPGDRGMQVVWLICGVAAASWQAWLLFSVGVRFFAWIIGAVLMTLLQFRLLAAGRYVWLQPAGLILAGCRSSCSSVCGVAHGWSCPLPWSSGCFPPPAPG